MKPLLHIIKNARDPQAIEIIREQSTDNSYGISVVILDPAGAITPVTSIPNIRIYCLSRSIMDGGAPAPPHQAEWISYEGLLDLIFRVESIAVW